MKLMVMVAMTEIENHAVHRLLKMQLQNHQCQQELTWSILMVWVRKLSAATNRCDSGVMDQYLEYKMDLSAPCDDKEHFPSVNVADEFIHIESTSLFKCFRQERSHYVYDIIHKILIILANYCQY